MRPKRRVVIVHQRRSPGKLLERVVELWPHSTGAMTAYCVKQLSFRSAGPWCAVKAAAIAIDVLRGTSDDTKPVIGHLLKGVNSSSALAEGGWNMKCGLTGGCLTSGPVTAGPLPTFPPETTEDRNDVSDVGREVGGVGMNTGTGFRQPIPREFEGAIAVISRLILLNSGAKTQEQR